MLIALPLLPLFGCPSPHGEGGLKFSLPMPGAAGRTGPSPHGEGGLKLPLALLLQNLLTSLPTRGGWIEIVVDYLVDPDGLVPPHTGRVD